MPNSKFGQQLLNQVETRHNIERAASKGRHAPRDGEAAEKRKLNRLTLEDHAETSMTRDHSYYRADNSTQYLEARLQEGEVGASLLQKMGWRPGRGLGRTESGPADFLQVSARTPLMGIGNTDATYSSGSIFAVGQEDSDVYSKRLRISKITASRYAAAEVALEPHLK